METRRLRRRELFTVTRQVAPLTDIGRTPVTANNSLRIRERSLLSLIAFFGSVPTGAAAENA